VGHAIDYARGYDPFYILSLNPMSHSEPSIEQVMQLVKELPIASQYTLLSALSAELNSQETDVETQDWLETDLGEDLPAYEWGEEGILQGKPVRYLVGRGLVVEGEIQATASIATVPKYSITSSRR